MGQLGTAQIGISIPVCHFVSSRRGHSPRRALKTLRSRAGGHRKSRTSDDRYGSVPDCCHSTCVLIETGGNMTGLN